MRIMKVSRATKEEKGHRNSSYFCKFFRRTAPAHNMANPACMRKTRAAAYNMYMLLPKSRLCRTMDVNSSSLSVTASARHWRNKLGSAVLLPETVAPALPGTSLLVAAARHVS